MKVISYVICALGLFGGVTMIMGEDVSGGIMALAVYGFFLALTAGIKIKP
jgi:hypothetical protein